MSKNEQKKIADEFDQYGDSYSETVNDSLAFTGFEVDFFTKVKSDYILDITSEYYGPIGELDVLDVGCGIGNYHSYFSPKFGSLSGVDVSEQSISIAKKRNVGVEYSVYDGGRLPYPDNSYDVVYTICVMHHVPPSMWENFVNEMNRVLRPGGIAMIFEHNPINPLTMRVVNRCPFDADAVLIKGADAKQIMTNSKFQDVDLRYILSVPAKGNGLRRLDKVFSKIPLGAQYYVCGRK